MNLRPAPFVPDTGNMQGTQGQQEGQQADQAPPSFTMPPTATYVPAAQNRLTSGAVFGQTAATFALAAFSGIVVGSTAAGITGYLLVQDLDDWAALTGIAIAILLGLVVMVVTYVVVSIVRTCRAIPPGQRAVPIVGLLLGPPVAVPVTWMFFDQVLPVALSVVP